MHRMRDNIDRWIFPAFGLALAVAATCLATPAQADLIRPHGFRAYPSIAGDMAGEQTYSYDQDSQTGVFRLTNAPHVMTLGPAGREMFEVEPEFDGTLREKLTLKLDREGKLVESPGNDFELRGSVTIDGKQYQGLLLRGRPTAFGAQTPDGKSEGGAGIFDLSLEVTGGELRKVFGSQAYFRITPQGASTFQGDFGADFSGGRPQTSLRAARMDSAPVPVPEPTALIVIATCGIGCLVRRRLRRGRARRRQTYGASISRHGGTPTASQEPRSRSGGRALGSDRGIRRSP